METVIAFYTLPAQPALAYESSLLSFWNCSSDSCSRDSAAGGGGDGITSNTALLISQGQTLVTFVQAWLNGQQVLVGTKCNKLLLLNVDTRTAPHIPAFQEVALPRVHPRPHSLPAPPAGGPNAVQNALWSVAMLLGNGRRSSDGTPTTLLFSSSAPNLEMQQESGSMRHCTAITALHDDLCSAITKVKLIHTRTGGGGGSSHQGGARFSTWRSLGHV